MAHRLLPVYDIDKIWNGAMDIAMSFGARSELQFWGNYLTLYLFNPFEPILFHFLSKGYNDDHNMFSAYYVSDFTSIITL